jgi:hypothetical protein
MFLAHNARGYPLGIVINRQTGGGFLVCQAVSQCAKERRNNAYILHFDADQTAQQPSSGGRSCQILGKRPKNTELTANAELTQEKTLR